MQGEANGEKNTDQGRIQDSRKAKKKGDGGRDVRVYNFRPCPPGVDDLHF